MQNALLIELAMKYRTIGHMLGNDAMMNVAKIMTAKRKVESGTM